MSPSFPPGPPAMPRPSLQAIARQRKCSELRPEEQLVAQVLPRVFDGVTVEQHDDGSTDGMYDLLMSGAIQGAVEVGQVTDEETRRARAHWAKNFKHHQTSDLTLTWPLATDPLHRQDAPPVSSYCLTSL